MDLRLNNFRTLFAYNSGKTENMVISYHDTREVFENDQTVGYTGDPRILFELQNQKVCYDFLREGTPIEEPLSTPLILKIHHALAEGIYDERRYLVSGRRSGTFKKQDHMTDIHEVGSYPEEVEGNLTELIGEINSIGPKASLKVGTYPHARFESIHPSVDRDDRIGRTSLDYWLMINDYSPMIIYREDKRIYYGALQQYNEQESLNALVRFLEAQTVKTWARVMKFPPNGTPKH